VPHILASDYAGAGFGEGYAQAELGGVCDIAERLLTVNAQRSKHFGPDARVTMNGGPGDETNLQSDFFWQWVLDEDVVGRALREPVPLGPDADVREMIRGYVAGFNLYLARTGVDKLPDPRCRGAAWVRPITEKDVYLRVLWVQWLANTVPLTSAFVAAAPPSQKGALGKSLRSATFAHNVERALATSPDIGSNAIALGKDATDNRRGMLFSNPHWYWNGAERYLEIQLTVPGKLNIYGAADFGFPTVNVGITQNIAWAQTYNRAKSSTLLALKLLPGDPTSYIYDNKVRKLQRRTVRVSVKESDGTLSTREHVFWSTPYGLLLADDDFLWTAETAYVLRDANTGVFRLNHELALARARTIDEIKLVNRRYAGFPYTYLNATDSAGNVLFANMGPVPHVTDSMLEKCDAESPHHSAPIKPGAPPSRRRVTDAIILDGSRSECEWGNDPGTIVPGTFAPASVPQLARSDYTMNSNNTHWLSNPHQPLEGYPKMFGPEATARSLRTREGLLKLESRLAGKDGLLGNRFTLAQLEAITLDNKVLSGELWRDSVVALCRSFPPSDDAGQACDVLAKWDLTENLDSQGAVLWRRFFENLNAGNSGGAEASLFAVPFDRADPINTPRGLKIDDPRVRTAILAAIGDLRNAHIPLNASLRNYQYVERAGVRIPIPGGPGAAGQYNVIASRNGWVAPLGWPDVADGSSLILWAQFTDHGPVGRSVASYSQSPNPASTFASDQTRLFSEKKTKEILFSETQIASDPTLRVEKLCVQASGSACH
jgi:acyl-homoserine-lactone acylase